MHGLAWYRPKERSWPSMITFLLRVSEISPLLCSSAPLFPTQPVVSSKFPHVPLGVGGWPIHYDYSTSRGKTERQNTGIAYIIGIADIVS